MKIAINRNNNHMFLKTLVLFFTVFSIHLKALPVAPRIIVLAIILLYVVAIKGIRIEQSEIKWILKCFFVLAFTWFTVFINSAKQTNAELPLDSAFNFLIFVGIFPVLLIDLFDDDMQFCKAMGIAGTIQSVIVILSALTPSMRRFLQDIQVIDFSRYNFRNFGLGVAGAGGSIYLFCSLFSIAYLIYYSKDIKIQLPLLYILNLFAIILIGRTGFYAAIVLTCFILVYVGKTSGRKTLSLFGWSLLIIVGLIVLYSIAVIKLGSDTGILSYTYKRLWEGLSYKESTTLDKLSEWNDRMLPLSLRTIFLGTGIVRGYSFDGLFVSHDGGYAKRYMSIGLIMAIYSYAIYYNYLRRKIRKIMGSKGIIIVCLFIMVVIEYKEPFMYQLALPFTLLMIVMLKLKTQIKKDINYEFVSE